MCVVQGKASWGGGTKEIIFTYAPAMLDIDDFNSRPTWYIENDIYYLEVRLAMATCVKERTRGQCHLAKSTRLESRDEWRASVHTSSVDVRVDRICVAASRCHSGSIRMRRNPAPRLRCAS